MAQTVAQLLGTVLETIDRPGSFCVSGSDRSPNPGLEVAGLGPIAFPLTAHQANELKAHCEQAPYGKGEETLVDTDVRRVWQLDPERFALTNPDWRTCLAGLVEIVQRELGLEKQKLESHLYKLLLYEAGSFFRPHRDGEKLDRMVATLVVVLPSAFTGGELVVRHEGEENTIDFSGLGFNPFHTHFAAFYADCEHEIRPLKTGHRLCLVYNLALAKSKGGHSAPRTGESIENVARILRGWSAEEPTRKLAIKLDHQYTRDGLVWDALKGVDRVKAHILAEAAKRADCRAYLALITLWESGSAEERYEPRRGGRRGSSTAKGELGEYEMDEIFDSSLTAEHWSDAEGQRPDFGEMTLEEEEVVPPESLTGIKPEEAFEGYTGNAGMTLERWYRHGAIVLWPKANHFDALCDCGTQTALGSLQKMVGEWKAGRDPSAKDPCVEFASKILARHAGRHLGQLGAGELLDALIVLEQPESVRAFLRDIVAGDRMLRPGKGIRAACEKFGWKIFREELAGLFRAKPPDPSNHSAAPDAYALEQNLDILHSLCVAESRRKGRKNEKLELCTELAEAFVANLGAFDKAMHAGPEWRRSTLNRSDFLIRVTRCLLAIRQFELFGRFIDRALADAKLYPLADQISALTALRPWLAENLDAPCESAARWVATCREQLIALTAREPTPPVDFRREANPDCKCADCAELKRFLSDPNERVHRFRASKDRRSHLEMVIGKSACDVSFVTERVGSPHVLACTKNTASFQARLKKFHADVEHLAAIRAMESSLPT